MADARKACGLNAYPSPAETIPAHTCAEAKGGGSCTNAAVEPHECPYASDVNNDPDPTYCRCCDECVHACAMDI